jgi:tetratricopeptide (TPR) repeat protein
VLTERDKLEQEALKLLEKGQTDRALERYQALLKADPRDRRVRQKVAELLLKLGRAPEAERHLREIVKALVSSGQERAAISVFQQLVKMRADDAELRTQLGDAYLAAGFPNDARAAYEQSVEMLRIQPAKAVEVQRRIIKLAPGEFPQKVKLGELMEAANWTEAAFLEWRGLSQEAQRLGRPDDRARFLELALRLRPDNVEVKVDAAEARVAMGEPRLAVPHLEAAIKAAPGNARALALLGTAYEKLDQTELARGIWLTVARNLKDAGDVVGRADALRHAVSCGATDPVITAELSVADLQAERARLRLDGQDWAQPEVDAELLPVVRASVQARYGFPDRARRTLEGSGAVRGSRAVRVALAELLAATGDAAAAVRELAEIAPPSPAARDQLEIRSAALAGRLDSLSLRPAPSVSASPSPSAGRGSTSASPFGGDPDDEVIDDEELVASPAPARPTPLAVRSAAGSLDEIIDDDLVVDEMVVDEIIDDEVDDDEIVDDEVVVDEVLDDEIVEDDATDHGAGPTASDPWARALQEPDGGERVEDEPTDPGLDADEWDIGAQGFDSPPEPRPERRPEPIWSEDADLARVEEAAGDALAASGRIEEALAAYRRSLGADPGSQEVLLKVGDLMSAARRPSAPVAPPARLVPVAPPAPMASAAPPIEPTLDFGGAPDFGEIFGGARIAAGLDPLELDDPQGPLGTARAWLLVGRGREALAALSASEGLEARLLSARARRLLGELPVATAELAAAVSEAAETDPLYNEALFELACCNAATGKVRAGRRLVEELVDLDPRWRPADVAALRRAFELLS